MQQRRTHDKENRQSLYAAVTDKIVRELEAGRLPWVQPWGGANPALGMPQNGATGRRYSGINILILWGAVIEQGFAQQAWLTFRQALALGGAVRKGERGTTVVFTDRFVPKNGDGAAPSPPRDQEGQEPDRSVPFLKRFTLFNVEQCDSLLPELYAQAAPVPQGLIVPEAEALIRATGAKFRIAGDRAFYDPARDTVVVPPPQAFFEPINWHRTAFHELGHYAERRIMPRWPPACASPLQNRGGLFGIIRDALLVRLRRSLSAHRFFPRRSDDMENLQALKLEYEGYLREQRGLSERSIYHCWRFADRFIAFRFKNKPCELSKIAALDIAKFMQHLISRGKPFRDKTPPTHLRNFFQFLFKSGRTNVNLAPSVPRIAQRYASVLPRHLTPDQVETVLAAVKADSAIGRRNYAMVLLLARLGLRAREVIAIQVGDIDWRAGELLVRGKGQLHDRLPLPNEVGEALANYIQKGRKTTSRALFVTHRAPHRPFVDAQVLNEVLEGAFRKANLKPPTRYVGSHILRHSLATNMVRRGASLAEIGDVLRHRARRSTMIYARVDVEGLRSVAREWPVTGGAK